MKGSSVQSLYGYQQHMQLVCDLELTYLGNSTQIRDRPRIVGEVGVWHMSTEKGWIPTVAFENHQPYYAASVLEEVANSWDAVHVVTEGRPDAVLSIKSMAVPQLKNKQRQLQKLRKNLQIRECPEPAEIPWLVNEKYLWNKYKGVTLSADIPETWCAMPPTWRDYYRWISVYDELTLLGAGYFVVDPTGTEWYWSGSVINYNKPKALEYAIGNCILMQALELAEAEGAQTLNFGVDVFDYKPQMWGTQRRWAPGLDYKD